MLKIKLKDNLRYFEQDDTDYNIQAGEIKELPDKFLRSYSIKLFLFSKRFEIVSGATLFYYKEGLVYACPDGIFGKELDKYFIKEENENVKYVNPDELPDHIRESLDKKTIIEQSISSDYKLGEGKKHDKKIKQHGIKLSS
ncbi:MAG: hypothetical protein PHP65_00595 [Bacilli bacterium]|nr:hypothetical protein [Bacilli bacterium]